MEPHSTSPLPAVARLKGISTVVTAPSAVAITVVVPFSTTVFGIDSFPYWHFSKKFVTGWEIFSGLLKSVFFGAAIAIIACHRGFHARAGAEGVGRAATEAFVFSFIAILVLDFLLGTFLMKMYFVLWPM